MFLKWLRKYILANQKQQVTKQQQVTEQQDRLLINLNQNLEVLHSIYANCADVVFRTFLIGQKTKAALIYIDGLSNVEALNEHVLAPLMQESAPGLVRLNILLEQNLAVTKVIELASFSEAVGHVSSGNPLLLIDGEKQGFALGLAKWEKRAMEEPIAESVLRGPRDGFIETLEVNTSLLRRKIKSPDLKMQRMTFGRYTQTQVIIAYIEGLTDKTLIEEVITRLGRIDIDGVLESEYLEELIEDNPFSPFPQVLNTERPDVAAASLMEGRVAILVDGTPFALIAPTTLYSLLQSPEDYYQRFIMSTAIRWLRYLNVIISLLLPSLYVAIITFHQEMVPTPLLLSMAASREGIPFPALMEALLMEVVFEALREAGVRLPKQVGAAVSIVGALVIGQAAVQAGLISSPMVMVVATTGIASFTIPRYTIGYSIRLLRFPIMFLAGTLGLLGIMLGIIAIVVHLCSLRSFGVPYLTPLGPIKGRDLKDVLIRAPWWMLNTRPHLTGNFNKFRQVPGQKPGPTKGDEK